MTDQEKINMLIQTHTRENNYLAMRLMLDVLKLSFKEALLKLEFCEVEPYRYNVEIADIRIHYEVEFFETIGEPSILAEVRRSIFYMELKVEKNYKDIYPNESYISFMEVGDKLRNMEDVHDDILYIAPLVEILFNEM